jgi:hypothetical protein
VPAQVCFVNGLSDEAVSLSSVILTMSLFVFIDLMNVSTKEIVTLLSVMESLHIRQDDVFVSCMHVKYTAAGTKLYEGNCICHAIYQFFGLTRPRGDSRIRKKFRGGHRYQNPKFS